jgi:hypothetical protein
MRHQLLQTEIHIQCKKYQRYRVPEMYNLKLQNVKNTEQNNMP